MAFFSFDRFCFASEGSRSFSIDCEHALGKDEREDLVEGEWFTVDLASQANRKEGDGFQRLDDAKDLSSVRGITSTYLFKTKRNDTRAPSEIPQSFKRPVRLFLLAQYILPIRDDNINPAHTLPMIRFLGRSQRDLFRKLIDRFNMSCTPIAITSKEGDGSSRMSKYRCHRGGSIR
jgi:hypothetical protein